MNKPLGFFGLDYSNQLVRDIALTWGDFLNKLPTIDKYWLIARLAAEAHLQSPNWMSPTDEAFEVCERLEAEGSDLDMPLDTRLSVMRALFDADHPIGYWGISVNQSPLLKDMVESWGENLSGCPDGDACWLIGRIAQTIWEELSNAFDQGASDQADEVVNRQHELKFDEKISLIQALLMIAN
ncbi:hypothetical protein AMR41_26230 [Hapalosiphon sp. MRB220]|nr:hypothetical protein AMR41_26230 [Hapalosiphon sp. MRB220]